MVRFPWPPAEQDVEHGEGTDRRRGGGVGKEARRQRRRRNRRWRRTGIREGRVAASAQPEKSCNDKKTQELIDAEVPVDADEPHLPGDAVQTHLLPEKSSC